MNAFDSFQDALKEYMELNGYKNIENLAKSAKIPRDSINGWLKGRNQPHINSAIRVADFCNYSLDYMFGLSDDSTFTKAKSQATFLERFTELSKKSGLTDYALAKRVGMKPATVAKWRYHGNSPQIPKLIKLTEIFNCSLDYLAGRSDNL